MATSLSLAISSTVEHCEKEDKTKTAILPTGTRTEKNVDVILKFVGLGWISLTVSGQPIQLALELRLTVEGQHSARRSQTTINR